jgi:hypothetical protein
MARIAHCSVVMASAEDALADARITTSDRVRQSNAAIQVLNTAMPP